MTECGPLIGGCYVHEFVPRSGGHILPGNEIRIESKVMRRMQYLFTIYHHPIELTCFQAYIFPVLPWQRQPG